MTTNSVFFHSTCEVQKLCVKKCAGLYAECFQSLQQTNLPDIFLYLWNEILAKISIPKNKLFNIINNNCCYLMITDWLYQVFWILKPTKIFGLKCRCTRQCCLLPSALKSTAKVKNKTFFCKLIIALLVCSAHFEVWKSIWFHQTVGW